MNRRGRPRNGKKPVWILERVILAVYAYGEARKLGEKHSVAVTEAVKYIRATAPAMRVSETEVKRIMAAWRPRGSPTCLFVSKPDPVNNSHTLPNGRKVRILYTAWVGPRPIERI